MIRRMMIERAGRTLLDDFVASFRRPTGAGDLQPGRSRAFERGVADASSGAVNEQTLARTRLPALEQGAIRRRIWHPQRGRRRIADPIGDGVEPVFVTADVFRVRPRGAVIGVHPISDSPALHTRSQS